ncbi:MAG: MoxR family ATPase [Gemmataceae bacterium]|nr:MoxR family ATPase [Gemmataceae bacterium]
MNREIAEGENVFELVLDGDEAAAERLCAACRTLLDECHKTVVGQKDVLEQIVLALLARGHCLLVGVPGLAKTLMVRTVADAMALSFNRIQFTPDLMPADITGTELLQIDRTTGERAFRFIHGPLFANVVLADEINRTPPRTQAALLESMQEHQVTVGGQRHLLPDPFFVLATQNPIEQEGTYPLPEAQQDRFMFNVMVDYPDENEEYEIVRATTSGPAARINRVITAEQLVEMQQLVRRVPVAPFVAKYALRLTRATRVKEAAAPDFVRKYVSWGGGPRASQYLVLAAKARAVLHGRPCASTEDVRAVAPPVLRHRILLNYAAEADGITPDALIAKLLAAVPTD